MKRLARLASISAALILAALCAPLSAAPLDDRVPADSIGYVGWAGADALKDQYGNSNLKGIIDASSVQDFVTKTLLPMLDQQVGGAPPDVAKRLDILKTALNIAWKHPVAFYFRTVDFSNPQMPMPSLGIICDAGPDAKALADLLTGIFNENPVPPQIQQKVMIDGNVVILSVGSADTPADLKKNGGLAGVAAYKAAMAKAATAKPAIAAYGDVPKAIALVNDALNKIPGAPPEVKTKAAIVIDALGINSLTQVAMTSGFDGKGWTDNSFVGISGPRKGILSLIAGTPLSDAILATIPKDSSAFSATKFDLHKLFTEVRDIVGKVDVQAQKEFDDGIAQAGMAINLDIEKDILAPLGDEWVLYRGRISDAGGSTYAFVHPLKDGPTFAKTLDTIEKFANANLTNSPIKVEKVSVSKTEVSTVAILQYSIAWTVKNGTLYVSTLDGIGGAMKQVENKSPSILTDDLYKAARAALPANAKPISISYANPAKIYPELRAMGMGVMPLIRSAGVAIPNDLLPDPDDIAKFMTPSAAISWSDTDGIHMASKTAFPGALMVGGTDVDVPFIAGLGAGIALPALGRARQVATVSVDAADLKGITIACLIYSADHNDKMPDNLAVVLAEGAISPKQLVSKQGGSAPLEMTPDLEKLSKSDPAKFAETVAEHSDYVYLGKGTKSQTDSDIVVVFSKPSPISPQGINIGYQDGHVEFTRWNQVDQAFKATNDMLKKSGMPAVDIQAMIKAAGIAVPARTDLP